MNPRAPFFASSAGKHILLVLGSLLVALLFGEAALQVTYKIRNGTWLWENSGFRIGYTTPIDDRRQYVLRAGFRDERAGITIDSFGFRESSPQAGPTGPLIVCAGDSVPFGAGVKDHETYTSYLAQLLPANGWAGGVLNAGVPSYNLRQTFDRIHLDVLPRVHSGRIAVVAIEAANDISLLTYYKGGWTPDRTWADVRWSASWVTWPQFQKVALIFYSAELWGRDRNAAVPAQGPIVQSPPGTRDDRSGDALNNVRKVLRTELTFLRDRSIPVVLMPINPFYYQTAGRDKNPTLRNWVKMRHYVEDWDDLIAQYNDVLAGTSKEFTNAYFFDTRPIMDAFDRDAMYLDFLHHSPLGNQIRATALLNFLTKRGLLSVRREVGT